MINPGETEARNRQLWSRTEPAQQKVQAEYIDKRWRQLYELEFGRADAVISYLMLANSGGAVATLSFMGAMHTVSPIPGAPAMLAVFILGFTLVGVLRAVQYHRMAWLFSRWRADVTETFGDGLSFAELIERDEKRAKEMPIAHAIGWLAFVCFIAGAVIGYLGMFNLGR